MIQQFVDRFMADKDALKAKYEAKAPSGYGDIVKDVIEIVSRERSDDDYCGCLENVPDKNRITSIDHGDYQGTIVYVIAEKGYQPSTYWYVTVSYGSCSGCDTFQSIYNADGYVTLALHIVQWLKKMGDNDE